MATAARHPRSNKAAPTKDIGGRGAGEGAADHLDRLASKYAGRPIRFFGDAVPTRFAKTETPVLCRIRPTHVTALDATEARP